MVPAANLLGFAGQELARKMPKVLGVIMETTLGSIVEIILFVVLISNGDQNIPVVRAAILGSILANLLLCMGLCFVAGGVRHSEQQFHETVSEVGSGLMLVAASTYPRPRISITSHNLSNTRIQPVSSFPPPSAPSSPKRLQLPEAVKAPKSVPNSPPGSPHSVAPPPSSY